MIQLFTDTSANLPLSLIRQHGIIVVPFSYTIDGVPIPYSEETDFDGKGFYDAMRRGAAVQTSLINTGAFLDAFSAVLQQGNDVLYIGMSGGISGTANSAAAAAKLLREKFPDRKIAAVDTFAASLGEGILVLKCAEMIANGCRFDEIEQHVLEARNTLCQYFTVDDLVYLKRGGRITGAAALVGTVLQIKPILQGNEIGQIVPCGKVRGSKRALEDLAHRYDQLAKDKNGDIAIAHADNPEGTAKLLDLLRKKGFRGNCLTVCYEPVTGAHVGPGTIALFFPGIHK